MARHPEVKEKEIIEAGLLLEQKGKMANPGAIRAQLGFKGGLVRIRQIWEKYKMTVDENAIGASSSGMKFEELPSTIADVSEELLIKQRKVIENIIVESFLHCQRTYDARLEEKTQKYESDISFYKEYEVNVDESISKLEKELKEVQVEATELAKQNANLVVENASLKGQVLSYEKALKPDLTKQKVPA